ncbi:MAG: D-aspartate ligase, partial [Streptomyces sp.]|nr:D-aspartate ligase [Streptomyces sp.]
RASGTELAWLARDDLKPFAVMLARFVRPGAAHLLQMYRSNRPNRSHRSHRSGHSRKDGT